MGDEYYNADNTQESSLFCPLDPIISYPCCKAGLVDFVVTPGLFVGMFFLCWFLGEEWGNRRSAAKFQKEGESIKGVVADSRNWTTTHHSDKRGTSTVEHFELTVKYPAEGATLQSPKCSHIVRKKFLVSSMNYSNSTFNGNGAEIEILRMPASKGYDPRKAILVCSLLDGINPCLVVALRFFMGILWNVVWSMGGCIAFMWAWPLALIIVALGFMTEGLKGDILDRHDDGVETGSDISNNHDGVETGSDNNQSSPSILV